MNRFDGATLAAAAAQWFKTLGRWPEDNPEAVLSSIIGKSTDLFGYLGVACALTWLVHCNANAWPPMGPRRFATFLLDPTRHEVFERHAAVIADVHAKYHSAKSGES